MGVVYVTYFESCSFSGKTTRAQCRETTLVSDLSKRVGLVHELAQWVRTEEGIDDTRYGLGIDEVGWGEHLIVAHIHPLAYGAAHSCQSDRELIGQLLSYRADTAVGQVVNIVYSCIGVDQLYNIFDNFNNVVFG